MASTYEKRGKWYVQYKDGSGRRRNRPTKARTKTEAKRLAADLERQSERQRLGLEPIPAADGGGTLGELLAWWLDSYSSMSPSHHRNVSTLEANLLNSEIGGVLLAQLTPGAIETYLQRRADRLGPQTLNHLRRFIYTAFTRAKQAGRWIGPNPAKDVPRRKVPKRIPDFLRAHEVPKVLEALSDKHRPLFATAIYTGMRRGELLGLVKGHVDFDARLITVGRSHGRDTTKGNSALAIPIADELIPYLRVAIERSPSDLVFPREDGSPMRPDVALEDVLRRALGRAGIVQRYEHVCRRKGCGRTEAADNAEQRRCPVDGNLLWPKAVVRPIRFHDLRHTTASLLMMAGANTAAVQRILRHKDPRITTEVYGHLAPEYLRDEVNRLRFAPRAMEPELPTSDGAQLAANAGAFTATLLPEAEHTSSHPANSLPLPREIQAISSVRHSGFEPLAFGSGGQIGRRSVTNRWKRFGCLAHPCILMYEQR